MPVNIRYDLVAEDPNSTVVAEYAKEFERYHSQQYALPSEEETAYLETLKAVQKKVEGKP